MQETKRKREEAQRKLAEVEVAPVELPTFDFEYSVLPEGPVEAATESLFLSQSPTEPLRDESWSEVLSTRHKAANRAEKARRQREEREQAERRRHEAQQEQERRRESKKASVAKAIAANAAAGKVAKAKRAVHRAAQREETRQRVIEEKAEKQAAWEAEQARRRAAWEEQKAATKAERKAKKARVQAELSRIQAEDEAERGRKLFVGKVSFADIQEDTTLNEFGLESLLDGRKAELADLFEKFGPLECTKTEWEKGWLFVVFESAAAAEEAYRVLSVFEERKRLAAERRQELKANLSDVRLAPLPTFYIRWPRKEATQHPEPE